MAKRVRRGGGYKNRGAYKFTAKRKVALKKAQAISARKRKGSGNSAPVRRARRRAAIPTGNPSSAPFGGRAKGPKISRPMSGKKKAAIGLATGLTVGVALYGRHKATGSHLGVVTTTPNLVSDSVGKFDKNTNQTVYPVRYNDPRKLAFGYNFSRTGNKNANGWGGGIRVARRWHDKKTGVALEKVYSYQHNSIPVRHVAGVLGRTRIGFENSVRDTRHEFSKVPQIGFTGHSTRLGGKGFNGGSFGGSFTAPMGMIRGSWGKQKFTDLYNPNVVRFKHVKNFNLGDYGSTNNPKTGVPYHSFGNRVIPIDISAAPHYRTLGFRVYTKARDQKKGPSQRSLALSHIATRNQGGLEQRRGGILGRMGLGNATTPGGKGRRNGGLFGASTSGGSAAPRRTWQNPAGSAFARAPIFGGRSYNSILRSAKNTTRRRNAAAARAKARKAKTKAKKKK